MEASLFLKDVITILKKYFWLILLLGVVGAFIGRYATPAAPPPTYTATSAVLIERDITNTNAIVNQSDENTRFLNTGLVLLRTPAILDDVKKSLDLKMGSKELASKVTILNDSNSQILRLNVQDTDPVLATNLANEILTVFVKKVGNYMDVKNVVIVDPATPGEEVITNYSRTNANTVMGVIIGMVIGTLLAYVMNIAIKRNRKSIQ